MRTDLFDFELPEDRIALHPTEPREAARLLVVRPHGGSDNDSVTNNIKDNDNNNSEGLEDRRIADLPGLLRSGDALVFNDTRVIPAALTGVRRRDGSDGAPGLHGQQAGTAKVSFNLHKRLDESRWKVFARPAKKLMVGDLVQFGGDGKLCYDDVLNARVETKGDNGEVTLAFAKHSAYLDSAIAAHGTMPLPPYIASKRAASNEDASDYQTIYAAKDGAVAAPTAGLHFTDSLMDALAARGLAKHFLTLHVGAGTFLPVKAEDTEAHVMHEEWGEITADTATALNAVRARGGRIVAVGTTALRLLESAADADGKLHAFAGETDIFITPGYRFRAVDLLLTNFHLPRSTLFMLVSAFSGLDVMQAAYAHAIKSHYRFYSYGDACLLYPGGAPDHTIVAGQAVVADQAVAPDETGAP